MRQASQNRAIARQNAQHIPNGLDYWQIAGLRSETRQKLTAIRPTSLGQAARISGITPADIAIISIWLNKNLLQPHKTTADESNFSDRGNQALSRPRC